MKKTLLFCLFIVPLYLTAQNPKEYWEWTKSIGGTGDDVAASFKIKNGYLYVTGTFTSPALIWDNTTLNNNGGRDIFVAKLDTSGNTVWVKNFGGIADDSVSILEINNNNQFVLLCKSASPSIDFTSGTLANPGNFYAKFDDNGNLLKSQVLPDSLIYTDIEIDNNGGVYAACNYARSFVFAGQTADLNRPPTPPIGAPVSYFPEAPDYYHYPMVSIPPVYDAGSALLKYDAPGNESWMKLFHASPVNLQIASDNTNIIAMFVHRGAADYDSTFFESRYFYGYPAMGSFPDANLTVVLSNNGITQRVINDQTDVNALHDFHFAKNGLGYASTSYDINIGGTISVDEGGANLKVFSNGTIKKDILNKCWGNIMWYTCQTGIPYDIVTARVAENSELLFNGASDFSNLSKIVYVVDSNFTRQDSLHIPNGDVIDLTSKAMDDGAVYFMDNFSTSTVSIQNNNYPNLPVITLNNAGNNDIFLGRYHRRGYMPLAFNNFDSTIKFCSGNFQINLQDTNLLHYRGTGNVQYRWEPAANFQNPGTLNTSVTMVTDTLTARLIINDGVDSITKIFFFRTGMESGLGLHLSDTVACGNGVLYASLTGSLFDTCIVKSLCSGNTWRFDSLAQVNNIYLYNSPASCDSIQTFRLEMLENSNYCSDTSTFTVRINPYYIAPVRNIYVCPGSSYTISGDTTYTNITGRIWRVKQFINQFGCDSVITTDINALPYTAGKIDYVCEGSSYTFPDGTVIDNAVLQPSGGPSYQRVSTIRSVYGCDSIYITTNLYVQRTNSRANTINLCAGSGYTFTDGINFSNIQADTFHTAHFTNINGCDSSVTTTVHILPVFNQTDDVSICTGGNYVFPDGTTFTNISGDTSHTSHFFTINNCDSSVTTNIAVLPTYNYIQHDSVCKGSSYTFPDHVQADNITTGLSHTSHLAASSGCDSTIVTNITITSNDTSIVKDRNTLTAGLNNAQYQWIDCSTNTAVVSETNQAYTAALVGRYAVQLTKNGCIDTSACYDISFEDLMHRPVNDISISPNPAGNTLRVQYLSPSISQVNISITDLFGRSIKEENRLLLVGINSIEMNIASLPRGIYLLVLYNTAADNKIVKRIIKN